MDKLIINVALTGCVAHKADNPALPITPEEVAADARRCVDLGATIFHVHARDRFGNAVAGAAHYRRYVSAVREAVPGAVVCASLSGRVARDFEERASALYAGPDMGSLTIGSVDFEGGTAVNSRSTVRALARTMHSLGILPECELFDHAHQQRLLLFHGEGIIPAKSWVNMIFGPHLPCDTKFNVLAVGVLGTQFPNWAVGGVGDQQWQANRWAVEFGGHVRTGLEDNLKMDRDAPATNPALVERVVEYARSLGREPATTAETREALGLEKEGE